MAKNACSCWSPEDAKTLAKFENSRNLTIRATRRLFEKFHDAHLKRKDLVLEIGAGLGFMRRNWPEKYLGRWIESDEQPAFLEGRENTQQASVYSLPFESRSFDIVCGFSSFDVLHDLESAFAEVDRVLRPGGRFFHFLDMNPSSTVSARWNERTKLPTTMEGILDGGGYSRNGRVLYIPQETLAKFEKRIARNPDNFDALWKKYARILDEHRLFRDDMIGAMGRFFSAKSIRCGTLRSAFRGKRTETQKEEDGCFVFVNDGFYTGSRFPSMMSYRMVRARDMKSASDAVKSLHPGNFLEGYCQLAYSVAKEVSQKLAEKLVPVCTEISQVHYVLARK